MADSNIKISIDLADAAAQKTLSDFMAKAGDASKQFKKVGDSGSGAFNQITVGIGKSIGVFDIFTGNLAANVVVGAFNAMTNAAGSLFNTFIVDGIKASQESADALNSLNVALAQSGNFSEKASEEFQAFAKQIQATTAFEDDAVIKNAALLASLTSLDNEGLKKATKAAVELSAALGKDLESTTEAIAKAANGNTTALNKMGIQFEKTGTTAGTFQNALEAINDKLGGTAASKLNTYSGAIAQSKNAFGDLQETIGDVITQNPAVVSAINAVTAVFKDTSESVGGAKEDLKILVGEGLVLFIDAATVATLAANTLVNTGIGLFNGFKVAVLGSLAGIAGALSFFSETAQTAFETFKAGASEAIDEINNDKAKKPLDDIATALARIGVAADDGLNKLKSGANTLAPSLENAKASLNTLTEAQKLSNEEANKFTENLARQGESAKSGYDLQLQELERYYEESAVINEEQGLIDFEAKLQREVQFYDSKQALLEERLAQEKATIEASSVDPSVKFQAQLAAQQKFQIDSEKLQTEHVKKTKTIDQKNQEQKVSDLRETYNTIATLSSSSNKTLSAIGKSFAIRNALVDGYAAVQKALSVAPPPFNFALAALVGAATAQNVANIAGVQFASGGIVPGTSFTGDKVQARLNSSEMVLNKSQQSQLFEIANGRGGSDNSALTSAIQAFHLDFRAAVAAGQVIQIDGKELFNVFRDGIASGRRV